MHSKMQVRGFTPALLKISNGCCVCVQTCMPKRSFQLVAENLQGNDPGDVGQVKVYDILYNEAHPCMAFCFELGDKAIFPVVTDGKEVKFEQIPKQDFTEDTFKETFLFQWGEGGTGNWQSLKSVANPSMYLFVEDSKRNMAKVTIKPFGMPYFKIEGKKETEAKALTWNSKRGPSCRAATALSTKPKCCPKRKTKKMKTFVKN